MKLLGGIKYMKITPIVACTVLLIILILVTIKVGNYLINKNYKQKVKMIYSQGSNLDDLKDLVSWKLDAYNYHKESTKKNSKELLCEFVLENIYSKLQSGSPLSNTNILELNQFLNCN